MFSRPQIRELFSKYTLVKLFTDKVPPKYQPSLSAYENRQLLTAIPPAGFGSSQLPLYVILRPLEGGKYQEVARYEEGKINNIDAFAAFLRQPLESRGTIAAVQPGGR